MMMITEDQFQKFSGHFATHFRALPPEPFYATVASLVPIPDSIKASLCSYSHGPGTTVWGAHLLTDAALAVAQVQFAAEQYTRDEEAPYLRAVRAGGSSAGAPSWQVTEAWVRPLAGITSYSTNVDVALGSDWFGSRVRLAFDDGDQPVELPAQPFDPEQRERSDKFLTLLRESIGWLPQMRFIH